jgi:hypothetical protein
MRILYIQPWGYSDYEQIERYRKGSLKNLDIPRVMFEVLYQTIDYADVDILDLNLELLENPDKNAKQIIKAKLAQQNYSAIFLTFPAVALGNQIGEIINICKKAKPKLPIVVGGEAVELMREDILKFWPADYCYCGYGVEIPQIIEMLKNYDKFADIAGLYKRRAISIVEPTQARGEFKLLDGYEPNDFYTLKGKFNFTAYLERYTKLGIMPSALLEMTRGCSHQCTFCAINKSGKVLFRNPRTVAAEAEFLLKNGINDFYLLDPTLGLNRKLTDELLALLAEVKKQYDQLNILAVTRTNLVNSAFAKKMKAAGINMVGLGVETSSQNQLNKIKKRTSADFSKQAVKIINRLGIKVKIFLIHFPDFFSQENINFLLNLQRDKADFIVQSAFYRPLYQRGKYKLAPDFRAFDQRKDCRSLKLDSNLNVLEFLICNLAFTSTDINAKCGDADLAKKLQEKIVFKNNKAKNIAIIINSKKFYLYKPTKKPDIIKSHLFVGNEPAYLKKISGLIIIKLKRR